MPYSIAAVPDVADGAVDVTVQGGTPGEPLYIFRRDSAGVGVVRDTSLATVLWPAQAAAVVTNRVIDPYAVTVGASAAGDWGTRWFSTGGAGTHTRLTGQVDGPTLPDGRTLTAYMRKAWTAASTVPAGDIGYTLSAAWNVNNTTGYTVTPGETVHTGVLMRRSWATGTMRMLVVFRTAAGLFISTASGVSPSPAAGVWGWVTVSAVAPATAATYDVLFEAGSNAAVPIGTTLDVAAGYVSHVAAEFTAGDQPATVLATRAWSGAANASTTTTQLFVPVVIADNEARQGEANVDYLLADGDGVQLASVRISLPLWGTWLKSPARPFLNTRCYLEREGPVKRPARREVVPIEGSSAPIVLSQQRAGRGGNVRLVAIDAVTDAALSRLLDQGDTLMLDTNPAWRLAYRYVNVGDVAIERSYWEDRGLTIEARTYELGDLVAVEAPIGVTAVEPGRTYSMLPTLYGSYAAMAATVGTYEELATGIA